MIAETFELRLRHYRCISKSVEETCGVLDLLQAAIGCPSPADRPGPLFVFRSASAELCFQLIPASSDLHGMLCRPIEAFPDALTDRQPL